MNQDVYHNYGSYIWGLIPMEWRLWWVKAVSTRTNHHGITMDYPPCIVCNETYSIDEFDSDIASGLLGRLRDSCNKYIMPILLCP